MVYKPFQSLRLSALGFGAMRLPVLDGDEGRIDTQTLEDMVALAMARGVNYYDTAWGYHGGQSERALGRALAAYPRDSFYLADKFPGYDLGNMAHIRDIFPAQLERCGVEYFDFYLVHNVCELNIDAYLDPQYGILDYLLEQKEAGYIRHLGFSAHGSLAVLERFLAVYGQDMEFCQLQLNYVDWDFQEGARKVALCRAHGLPVFVMEPLRGGRLARLSPQEAAPLSALRPGRSLPDWAFGFVRGIPEVALILSGMSDLAQLRENLDIFDREETLDERERQTLLALASAMVEKTALPCTACRYCTAHCPQGLDIPALLSLYNEHCFTGGGFIAPMALAGLPAEKQPAACLGCRACEAVCPQRLKIAQAMADFAAKLG